MTLPAVLTVVMLVMAGSLSNLSEIVVIETVSILSVAMLSEDEVFFGIFYIEVIEGNESFII